MPKQVDHAARRAELIEASWAVIARAGLEGLTMRKVAAEAGCTTGRITHYFADREALVLAALRAVYDAAAHRIEAHMAADMPPRDKLVAVLEEGLPLDATRLTEWRVWIAFWSAATTDRALARENDDRHARWRASLIPLIGEIAPGADAEAHALTLTGLVDGLGLAAAVSPTAENRRRAQDAIHAAPLLTPPGSPARPR